MCVYIISVKIEEVGANSLYSSEYWFCQTSELNFKMNSLNSLKIIITPPVSSHIVYTFLHMHGQREGKNTTHLIDLSHKILHHNVMM